MSMPISAVMFFRSGGNARALYDDVIDEMGVRDNAPRGAIYHWCAPVEGGLRACDAWETREDFERFAHDFIGPASVKHGLAAPDVDVQTIHELIVGRETSRAGTGVFLDFDGDSDELLRKIDSVNERLHVTAQPPEGLAFHWSAPSAKGVRVIDHWRSREDFERFVQTRLADALGRVSVPQPRIQYFEVYNTIDRRVAARL